jgi:hypothetical protein
VVAEQTADPTLVQNLLKISALEKDVLGKDDAYRVFMGKPEEERPLGGRRSR